MRPSAIYPIVFALAACGGAPSPKALPKATPIAMGPSPERDAVVHGEEAFLARLYSLLPPDGNLLVSPASARIALGMAYFGAGGETMSGMRHALAFGDDDAATLRGLSLELLALRASGGSDTANVGVSNRLWGQAGYSFAADFLALVRSNFDAPLIAVDFLHNPSQSVSTINAAIDEATRHMIPTLLTSGDVDSSTRLVLTNAIYFYGAWAKAMKPAIDEPFFVTPTTKALVPTMISLGDFRYAAVAGYQIVEVPYATGDWTMLVVVPNAGEGAATSLDVPAIGNWVAALHGATVELHLPKIRLADHRHLQGALATMGMGSAFGKCADFTKMDKIVRPDPCDPAVGSDGLRISEVIQVTKIEVSDKGTEAAAATAVVTWVWASPPPPPIVVRADHPFLYLIRNRTTGTILFVGREVDPNLTN